MAYPEPIPPLRGRNVEEFLHRLEDFRLSRKQKEFYKDAKKMYRKMAPKEQDSRCILIRRISPRNSLRGI